MKRPFRRNSMLVPTIIMGVLAIILYIVAWSQGSGQQTAGLKIAFMTTLEILPLIFFAFIVAGLVQTLLPQDLLSRWVGVESGFRGILIGTIAGGFTPGGPYVSLPVVASLIKAGAGNGTMVAFLTSWSLWAVSRLPMEVGILGWKFTAIRVASTFFFPPFAGIIANMISKTVCPVLSACLQPVVDYNTRQAKTY